MPKRSSKKGAVHWKNRIVRYGDVDLSQALANPDNWRTHPYEQAQALEGVLETVGIVQTVIVNLRTSKQWPKEQRGIEIFIDGHLRATRAMSRGIPSLPGVYVDLDPQEEALVLGALDKIGSMAKADDDRLRSLFEKIRADDARLVEFLSSFADEYGMTFGGEKKEVLDTRPRIDEADALVRKWDVRFGDLWALGDHRLICADSADPASVRRLLEPGGAAVYGKLMSTDAPYLVGYFGDARPGGGGKDWSSLYDERAIEDDPAQFLIGVFEAWVPYLAENAAWFLWHASKTRILFEQVMEHLGLFVHEEIIWKKPVPVMSFATYFYQHEPCLFGWRKGHQPHKRKNFFGAKNSTTWSESFDGTYTIDDVFALLHEAGTFWEIDYGGKKRQSKNLHPTEKPIELFARPMRNHTHSGDVCFEPFSGSGSQILAGEKTGRVVYASEKMIEFVAVSLQRFVDVTGIDPVLIERGPEMESQDE